VKAAPTKATITMIHFIACFMGYFLLGDSTGRGTSPVEFRAGYQSNHAIFRKSGRLQEKL
ncbi:MAG TPA: hypothetical protein VLK33_02005, partial [Terriglobales bacterium]|nr:hypothetical protein [Terriglobales bacterium]